MSSTGPESPVPRAEPDGGGAGLLPAGAGGGGGRARGHEVAKLDELERLPVDPDEGLVWRPVRRHFGIRAFGANAYTAAEAGDRVVEEHAETTNQHEELYFVAAGRATFTVDGDEVDAPAGTFVFVQPQTRRGAIANEPGTTVLAVGGRAGTPFQTSAWEAAFAAFAYQRTGDTERALATMREAYEGDSDHWAANYNFACMLALHGLEDEALEKLERAVGLNAEAAELARGDEDFASLRNDPRFVSAVAGQPDSSGA
jgi:mannose-6-phosphate isomerase-like protein (cupin superfamily)